MFWDQEDFDDAMRPLATMGDAVREYVHNVGRERPDLAWIVSQYDTRERNPFYTGPAVPHPDAYGDAYGDDLDGDIPF